MVETTLKQKPLGHKAYGSIPHLPGSRVGPSDWTINQGQARICTGRVRDCGDRVIVQEKLDGSCTAVALVGGELLALNRAGWLANSSPHENHHLFSDWVVDNEDRFRSVLREGERIVGEWLAQAVGTRYDLRNMEPWVAFDLMVGSSSRKLFCEFKDRVGGVFLMPHVIHEGVGVPAYMAMQIHEEKKFPCDKIEGVVYRVERGGKVEFLAKWVHAKKVDGKYLPEISGLPGVWNWRPGKDGVLCSN